MGKRIGAVVVSALLVVFAVAVFGFPTSVESVYPTPTPTPPVGSCTGWSDCIVSPGTCGDCLDSCHSTSTTRCRGPSGGAYQVCSTGCSNNTSCCSVPPAGCPSDRSGCSWSGANDCGGGVCGCGERRTATLWCSGQHCDDICTSDQACIADCNGPTPTPIPPTPTPGVGCTPNCIGAGSVCSGTTFNDSCGYPTCTGTQQPDCSGAGGFCSGTTYDVVCGTCTGTKVKDCSGAGGVCSYLPPYPVPCGTCTPTLDCTICNCSDPSGICSGTTFNDSCGKPACTGTKQPDCSGAGSVCSGTAYAVACGTCTGTKQPDCSGAGSVCSGTAYPAACGTCIGTKPCPTPPIVCPDCGTPPNCYNSYCSGVCINGCSSLDCSGGVCILPGIIQARAMVVTKPNTSCDYVKNSTTTLTGTVTHQFTLSSASQPTQVQSGSSYTVFNNVIPGSYTIDSQVPAQYVLARACWTSILDTPSSGESKFHELTPADTLTWDLGYTSGVAWSQVQGGDVYAGATLKSYVPAPHPTPPPPSTRVFILNGDSGYPGVATYGTDYNFDSSGLTHGETWVSSKNWLVNDTAPATDFYQLMYRQFGGAPATVDYVNPVSPIAQPPPRATPYYVTGNMTTSGDWLVGAGSIHVERIIKT